MKKLIYLTITIFSILPIIAESKDDPLEFAKKLYKENKFAEAEIEINKHSAIKFSNPEYDLLQSKIWIELGNQNYNQRKFSTAYKYFSKAFEFWSADPLVQQRYYELKNKELIDEENKADGKRSKKTPNLTECVAQRIEIQDPIPEFEQIVFKINETESKLTEQLNANKEKLNYLIIGNIVFMNLFVITLAISIFFYLKLKRT
ncbi:hypothetical protein [Leptospira jelokensis]|uniref:Tetratricopeptide repeat protein n=1 Tax=Leptospira jelokensis TaxID=2484931 RepID=A0A4Z0ZZT3_9LEPT|nr:hypothetical protein [Leptospira jelokensis]TGL58570.1 hypothetical protein EHQ62_16875 [Leptospira jelokensis]